MVSVLTQAPLFCFLCACVSGLTCVVSFIICLLFSQYSGMYWVTLFDNFAGSIPLLTVGLFEMIAVVYIYGIDRFVLIKTIFASHCPCCLVFAVRCDICHKITTL